jgi:hypothetical protein
MPLCLEREALTHFLASGLHLPASHEPRDDPLGLRIDIGARESLDLERFFSHLRAKGMDMPFIPMH